MKTGRNLIQLKILGQLRSEYKIFILLTLLNIIIRIPHGPHELGTDTFVIHSLAANIVGNEKLITHPLVPFGLYPNSYPYAAPFILSSFSQLISIDIEHTILLTSILFGILGMLTSYIMASEFSNRRDIAYIVAFIYSISPVFIRFTLWTASTRNLFMVILPLLVFLILRINSKEENKIQYIILTTASLVLLATTHRMFFLTIIIMLSFFIALLVTKFDIKIYIKNNSLKIFPPYTILLMLLLILQFPPFNVYGDIWFDYQNGILFQGSTSFILFLNMVIDYTSRSGLLAIFALGGLISLLFESERNFNEIFLLIILLGVTSIVSMGEYMSLFSLPFISLLIGYGIIKLTRYNFGFTIVRPFILICIIGSVIFSQFMLFHWGLILSKEYGDSVSVSDATINMASYLKNYGNGGSVTTNSGKDPRISAYSGAPSVSRYIYENESNLIIEKQNFSEWYPKIESLYTIKNPKYDIFSRFYPYTLDNNNVKNIISITNLRYIVIDETGNQRGIFESTKEQKAKIYDNKKMNVWYLDKDKL